MLNIKQSFLINYDKIGIFNKINNLIWIFLFFSFIFFYNIL
ncbi:hypothetical protein CNEO4_270001 [Clostridium neonatale]|uniref:Uncharacterized protein n=1 Tax=Clostridium neonatale TaxID=137838 RepID=A0AA86JJT8_9CLOT|nr:hypothetical protein CNEO_43371 [Clostridium neonatale]CAG9708108.1 hypothetical protein CNEO_280001 [Clostridium neonatale]CAG9715203.1 hypothetical protein CNEO_300054 [Clostridium neonatale]CAI3196558.1 hypothetical protein CNEO2_170035 [Clostridium neonatale]CAI3203592.1 hypothetical protein CNEO2_280033 [Clostridium neonatale]